MRQRSKLLLAGLTAALLLSMAVGSASANRLSTNERNFRVVWNPLSLEAAEAIVECNVTLEGSFHTNAITKEPGSLIGHITRAALTRPCTGGTATILTETLPWHVVYGGYGGRLPAITGVTLLLLNASFRVDPASVFLPACLARTTVENPAAGTAELNEELLVTGLTPDPTALIPLSGGFGCGIAEGSFSSTNSIVTRLGTTREDIKITLI